MENTSTKDKAILVTAVAGLVGWLFFRNKIKLMLKEKAKDLTAKTVSRELGISSHLGRSAADIMLD